MQLLLCSSGSFLFSCFALHYCVPDNRQQGGRAGARKEKGELWGSCFGGETDVRMEEYWREN